MKTMHLCLLISMLILLVGCGPGSGVEGMNGQGQGDGSMENTNDSEPEIVGYVVKSEGGKMLVVSSEPQDFSATGGLEEFYNAVWVSDVQEKVHIGEKVKVWFEGPILESYPAQATAEKVLILPSTQPKGADLTEAQAIEKALDMKENGDEGVLAIKAVHYDPQTDKWEILMIDTFEYEEYTIQIDDE